MIISTYQTSINNSDEAERMIELIQPFFLEGILKFDLEHPDKILTIQSEHDEYHPEFVIGFLKMYGYKCKDISNHPPKFT